MTHDESPCTYREAAVKLTVSLREMLSKKIGEGGLERSAMQKKTVTGEEHVREAMPDTQFSWN